MEHGAYKEMLSALLDGELSGAAREAALAHLDECADCRAYFEELTALRAALGDMEEYDAPEGFAAGVMARIRAGDTITRIRAGGASETAKKRFLPRRYAALAACAAVVLLAVYALPNALRMGGNQSAAPSMNAAPKPASGAPAAPAEAATQGHAGLAAPAPDFGYNYVYTDGADNADETVVESGMAEERGAEDAGMSAARNDGAADVSSNGTAGAALDSVAADERYATTAADDKRPLVDSDEAPMAPLSRPEAWGGELPVLTLTGADAESWLAEHGWQGESGAWYAEADALRALPETLTVLYGELSEDYDGAVLIELWLVEPSAEAEP